MGTKITLQMYDESISWETPIEDCDINQVIQGFYNVLLGSTFHQDTIVKGFQKFVDDKMGY